jgi:hypothetical protein
MKPYRVTLKYILNDHTCTISTVIPACNEDSAISSCMKANNIKVVIDKRANLLHL